MSPGPDFRGADRERCVSYFTLLWWSKNTLSTVANDLCVVVGSLGGPLPPSPPAEKATARQDQTGQASTGDGAGDGSPMRCLKKKKRADRRGRPARSGDELTTTASCQGKKATACQDQAGQAQVIRQSVGV